MADDNVNASEPDVPNGKQKRKRFTDAEKIASVRRVLENSGKVNYKAESADHNMKSRTASKFASVARALIALHGTAVGLSDEQILELLSPRTRGRKATIATTDEEINYIRRIINLDPSKSLTEFCDQFRSRFGRVLYRQRLRLVATQLGLSDKMRQARKALIAAAKEAQKVRRRERAEKKRIERRAEGGDPDYKADDDASVASNTVESDSEMATHNDEEKEAEEGTSTTTESSRINLSLSSSDTHKNTSTATTATNKSTKRRHDSDDDEDEEAKDKQANKLDDDDDDDDDDCSASLSMLAYRKRGLLKKIKK